MPNPPVALRWTSLQVRLPAVLLAVSLSACGPGPGGGGGPAPRESCDTPAGWVELACGPVVENLAQDEQLHHGLVLVTGRAGVEAGELSVTADGVAPRSWPVLGGRFKALVPLREGENVVLLRDGSSAPARTLRLRLEPHPNPRFIRLVWVQAADGDGGFEGPVGTPRDAESARKRLALGGLLLQSFTAESLFLMGHGRRTFRLELEPDGMPRVETFRSALTLAEARARTGNELWSHFYGELASLPRREDSIDLVLMSMTDWDGATKTATAHTALGGGRLALFGSGTLYSWPETLDGVVPAWTDARDVDTSLLMDDSAYRDRYWANFATGLGACLHELGHTLSLPHPASGRGVMAREFDHVNRLFMLEEPPSARSPGLSPVRPEDEKYWDPSHGHRLRWHAWLRQDGAPTPAGSGPSLRLEGGAFVAESAAGLRHLEYSVDGQSVDFDAFDGDVAPTRVEHPRTELSARLRASSIRVSAIDSQGRISEADLEL
jgi:hypothetical protein